MIAELKPQSKPFRLLHVCAAGGMKPGDIDECEACQKAERLPRPQTEPLADKRTVGISLALAKVSLMGLENHARTIRCKLSMLGIPKSTRETLNHDLSRYNAAIRELKGVIRAATIN